MRCVGAPSVGGTLLLGIKGLVARHESTYRDETGEAGDQDPAFTLVETMAVVAIVAVLAAIAMLSYAHFIKKSQSIEADIAMAEIACLEEV